MVLRKLMFLVMVAFIFGCNGDNDDDIEENDVTNIDLTEGITFGVINPTNGADTFVYQYTDQGLFLVTNSGAISSEIIWETTECPFDAASVSANFAEDVPNVARGIRDIASTDIQEIFNTGLQFYVLEYVTSGNRKTIQFDDTDNLIEEQINEYFSFIRRIIPLISTSGDVPLTAPDCTPL